MKTQLLSLILICISNVVFAQNQPLSQQADSVVSNADQLPLDELLSENDSLAEAAVLKPDSVNKGSGTEKIDTVHIRVGKHAIEIVTDDDRTQIDVDKLEEFGKHIEQSEIERAERKAEKHKKKKFNGHWGGIDFGGNQLLNTTYPESLYPAGTPEFMTTAPEKSFEVNVNLFEYSFGFSSYVGLVTGLGLNFNDYKFRNRYTLVKDDNGVIQPQSLPEGDFRLSKLSTTFIHAPLMLEVQIPGQYDHKRIFIAGGVIGGVKIHEHVKTKIGSEKKRDNGNYNVAPIRWGYTARVGFEDVGIFATYYNTKFFEKGLGPEATPFTVGLAFAF
jgi:hypothetical protein